MKKFSRNIIIGDVKTAKIFYTAHYDTPAALPFPNFITPKSLFWFITYQLLITLIFVIPYVICNILCTKAFDYFYYDEMSFIPFILLTFVTSFAPLILLGIVTFLMLCGPANKKNFNDNTSGVITLIELYNKMSIEAKNECAFVFFDNEEKGLLGSRLFKKYIKKK